MSYSTEITNTDGMIRVVLFGPDAQRLFSRTFSKICDAERWLTTLARTGLTARAITYVEEDGRSLSPLPPFVRIFVTDARVSKRAALPAWFA